MNSNKKLNITNTWICQISGQKIVPVFGDISVSEGHISEIKKKDFKSVIMFTRNLATYGRMEQMVI